MSQELVDGEFWLPPQFLTDDMFMDFMPEKASKVEYGSGVGFLGPKSDLSSPVESVMGSTETESDEEDYLTGLTRKLGYSSLNDDMWKIDNTKSWGMATSPQSTLCNLIGTCTCGKQGSSRGSPTCLSPPSVGGVNKKDGAWDLLYAAAGEVARLKLAEQAPISDFRYNNRGFVPPSRKPTPISLPPNRFQTPNLGLHSNNQALFQFQQMEQQKQYQQGHHQQQMFQNRGRTVPNNKPVGLSLSSWPTLQQSQQPQGQQPPAPGSGMRAVFLGNPAAKRECAGTGVFLPRQIGSQPESRKKRGGCSTVLLPDRVVQALNLNLEPMDSPPLPQPRIPSSDYNSLFPEVDLRYRTAVMAQQQQRRSVRHLRQQPGPIENELRLPQEWTY